VQTWKACWGNPQEFESLILRSCDQGHVHAVINDANRMVSILVQTPAAIYALTSINAGPHQL